MYVLTQSTEGYNCGIYVSQTNLNLTKFVTNSINICVTNKIYYKNIFYNQSNETYFIS